MNIEYFITRKLIKDKNKSRFSKNAIGIAVLSVAIGLAIMILSIAIVTGFKKEIADKVIGFGAHIQISSFDNNLSLEGQPIQKTKILHNSLLNIPEIDHIQVYGMKPGIIKTNEYIQGIVLKGIDSDFKWAFFEERLLEGKTFKISDSITINSIMLSKHIADLLKVKIGDKIQIWFIQTPPRVRVFEIKAIYETGLEEFDKIFVFGDIKHIQRLNNWSDSDVSGIEIFLNDINSLENANSKINESIGYSLHSQTIKDIYPSIFEWLNLLDMNTIFILLIMLLVASINMITTLLIIILERTNMIGLLKAIGAQNVSIAKIFLYYSFFILIKGLFWGNLIGISICILQSTFGIISLPQESYFVSTVPININLLHLLLLNLWTVLCCLVILILPTFIVAKISPVSAIKYD